MLVPTGCGWVVSGGVVVLALEPETVVVEDASGEPNKPKTEKEVVSQVMVLALALTVQGESGVQTPPL